MIHFAFPFRTFPQDTTLCGARVDQCKEDDRWTEDLDAEITCPACIRWRDANNVTYSGMDWHRVWRQLRPVVNAAVRRRWTEMSIAWWAYRHGAHIGDTPFMEWLEKNGGGFTADSSPPSHHPNT